MLRNNKTEDKILNSMTRFLVMLAEIVALLEGMMPTTDLGTGMLCAGIAIGIPLATIGWLIEDAKTYGYPRKLAATALWRYAIFGSLGELLDKTPEQIILGD